MIPFSVLDLSPIVQGATAADSFRNTLDLAQHAEAWGYKRYWLAEHHNMPGIASAATAVVIGHVAAGTKTIRVGSGGIMLPNHAPLVIAEQFGTLASLFPGRIDLGLGRAPGTDMMTARALRRDRSDNGDRFPQDVVELQMYFEEPEPNQPIRAVPGAGLLVPIWLLGSSLFSAQLAAMMGLPFAFASHFAPDMLMEAFAIYRARFEPSAALDRPHAMVAVNLFAADTETEARRLFSSAQQQFANLRRGTPGPLPAPIDDINTFWRPGEQAMVERALAVSAVGTPDMVESRLREVIRATQPDEVILAGQIFDHAARLRSFQIGAEVRDRLGSVA
ncbi:LLM class flavin-dependent oxidoreductase [Azospirillum doebereinerae]|uniref:Luciferase-like monooxygenase n=1 Tax=Azospirillum doebereinerae TaxID=92933 RepID=A0A3S0V551_9PROT|nr:LLM class flavin-dependent oxidoreductase [Azospirillum doebereinerae]RUQ67789.1 LLM class flavin-dependent oxidoreductase [Azospirillum doebereinerae]